jgi:ZIP family zinc transporter
MWDQIPVWGKATIWGIVSGSALLIGAAFGYLAEIPKKVIAFVMAFGSGVLISALAFNLMEEAYGKGGMAASAAGFVSGALLYSGINYLINKKGAKHRKRSGTKQPSEQDNEGSGIAIALGSLLDGIPEAFAIGASMIESSVVSLSAVIAIFLSNIPEALSSTDGMRKSGRSAKYIFGIWIGITILSGIGSLCGYTVFKGFSPEFVAATVALAAGAILAMLSSTMIPEAFEEAHDFVGIITVAGFLAAFIVTKQGA